MKILGPLIQILVKHQIWNRFDVGISSLNSGQVIRGKTELQIELPEGNLSNAKEIKYLLLDQIQQKVYSSRGEDIRENYTWIPDLEEKGKSIGSSPL